MVRNKITDSFLAHPIPIDFQFSLNLPENITPSDFNLVSSPEFGNLFGLSSMGSGGPFTPSALIASANSTPKGSGMMGSDEMHDDIIMTSSASHHPSISSALGLGLESQMTSMPTGTTMAPTAPPQSADAPSQTLTFQEYMARNAMSAMPQQAIQQQDASRSLFDANESNFLTNFLQGFEGWDFNPFQALLMQREAPTNMECHPHFHLGKNIDAIPERVQMAARERTHPVRHLDFHTAIVPVQVELRVVLELHLADQW